MSNKMREALVEAERFMSYFANETDGVFAGSGTPTSCLANIRSALVASSPINERRTARELEIVCLLEASKGGNVIGITEDHRYELMQELASIRRAAQ